MKAPGIGNAGRSAHRMGLILLAAALALAWAFGGPALAAPKSPLDSPKAFLIKPRKDPKGGKTAFVDGTATARPSHLELKDLAITRPLKLVVLSEEKGKEVTVELRRYPWQKPWKTCSTGTKGDCGFALRVQGDLYITLISPQGPAPVFIGVQVGEEDKPNMKPVLVPKGK
jgi:hypothetical protein